MSVGKVFELVSSFGSFRLQILDHSTWLHVEKLAAVMNFKFSLKFWTMIIFMVQKRSYFLSVL